MVLPVAWLLSEPCAGQVRPASADAGYMVTRSDFVAFSSEGRRVEIRVCRPNVVNVRVAKEGQPFVDTPAVAIRQWPESGARIVADAGSVELSTDRMVVKVGLNPYRLSVFDAQGTFLIGEHARDGVSARGVHFSTRPGSHFYGLKGWEYLDDSKGQMEMGPAAQAYAIKAGAEGNTGGPLLWSNLGYGVFVDTVGGFCHIGSDTEVRFYDLSQDAVSYYIVTGSAFDIQKAVAELTGLPPMFPKWAMGFSNSEYAEMNEAICENNIAGYRSRGIPLDLYTFDFQWKAWGEDDYGEWRWNRTNFPNGPSGDFRRAVAARGVKLAGIMKPRIHVDSVQGRYATEHGFWVQHRAPYRDYFSGKLVNDLDFENEACRAWFWEHAAPTFDSGIVGWWNDEADAWGSPWEGMRMAQAIYEGQRAHTKDQVRVWTNNRNFYSGSQRYAYATWSGDIESGFAVMRQQRERLLCSVNVGQARWGMDAGGFNNNFRIEGAELSESYARWIEFAAFVPVFRTHGTSYRQPWLYGPVAEAAAKRAIRLRYALIPYIYSCERNLNQTGIGLVRPLVWNFPNDPLVANDVDAWMFGDCLLVAPVVERGQTCKEIYLPAGEWIDYFRGDHWKGPQVVKYPVDSKSWLDIPLFVKSGGIVPTMEVQNFVGEAPVLNLDVEVFPDPAGSSFVYYDDDGMSYDYEKGAYFSQEIRVRRDDAGVTLAVGARSGTYEPALKWYTFRVHGAASETVMDGSRVLRRVASLDELRASPDEAWTPVNDATGALICVKLQAGVEKNVALRSGAR